MKMNVLLALILPFALSLSASAQAGVTGKWQGEIQAGQAGPQQITMDLKADGATLTGTLIIGQMPAAEIQNGKIDQNVLTFTQVFNTPNGPFSIGYVGKLSGDEIAFSLEFPGGPAPLEFTMKRAQ